MHRNSMKTYAKPDFQTLRDQWALKAPLPSASSMEMEMRLDISRNPHNDSHKPQRRSEAEIISDRAYAFADSVLRKAYGELYIDWMKYQEYEIHPR